MTQKRLRLLLAEGSPGEAAETLRALYAGKEQGLDLTIVSTVATLLGLGVAVDYGLFLVARHREQVDAGMDPIESAAKAESSAGTSIVVAGSTVVVSILGLYISGVPFVGAMGLLLLTGTPLNVSSFMGLILLVGLIVKNGIILLDFTHHRMQTEGVPLDRALVEAGGVRLRPILMTTLCTLFGLLPLSLGLGAGSEMQRPLALAVIGGLTLSTPITLYVVPTLLVAIRGGNYRLPRTHFRHEPRH